MEGAERELFERSVRHATETHTADSLDAALAELGWPDALEMHREAAVSTLFSLQGEANATSSAIELVLGNALGLEGPADLGLLLPPLGRVSPPGTGAGPRVAVLGLATFGLGSAKRVRLVSSGDDGWRVVAVDADQLTLRTVRGVDPVLGLVEASGEAEVEEPTPIPGDRWDEAVAVGQLALAHELLGASRRMLSLAREHALERIQFGRPIGTFQAVRHRLAETLIAIEGADAAVSACWDPCTPRTSAIAKALAGRAALGAARNCQQVLAGIGFTAEHPFHRYVRRVLVLDQLLGSSRSLTRGYGAELLATRRLPDLLPL